MKAKAAVFVDPNKDFEVREFDVTPCPKGYGQMKLIASSICGTDIHIHNGKLMAGTPSIIGHEFVGQIVDLDAEEGAKHGLKIGDNVVAYIAVPCDTCALCKSGDDANCVNMQVTTSGSITQAPYLYGGYAQMNYTPLPNLIRIPDSVDPVVAATFACPGPTDIHAVRLARQAGVDFSKINVAVVQGLGPVGVFAVMYLKAMGIPKVHVITTGRHPAREAVALEVGPNQIFRLNEAGPEAVTKALQAENGGLGVDLCLEASGVPSAVPQGMEILRNRGVYLIPGQYSAAGSIAIQPELITFKALHIIGSSQYSLCDVQDYLAFLEQNPQLAGSIEKLGTKFPLEQINEAMAYARSGKNVKTMLI